MIIYLYIPNTKSQHQLVLFCFRCFRNNVSSDQDPCYILLYCVVDNMDPKNTWCKDRSYLI